MNLELEDLLSDKPFSLIMWNLDLDPSKIISLFKRDTEIKLINSIEEVTEWLKVSEVENLVIGERDENRVKEFCNYLKMLPLERRRNLFILVISPSFKTLDSKETFLLGVNLLVNTNDVENIDRLVNKTKKYWDYLYMAYKNQLRKLVEVEP